VWNTLRLPARSGLPTLDRSRRNGTAAAALLEAAPGADRTLAPLDRTDIQRLHRRARYAGAFIEIADDVGPVVAGSQSQAVDAIECALISGPAQALPALTASWAQRHGLWWDVRTRSARGFGLARRPREAPAVKVPRARCCSAIGFIEER
jgi:triphosphatase